MSMRRTLACGKRASHHILDLLRSGSKFSDKTGPALRALRNLRLLISTVMADHFSTFVYGQGYITVWTLDHMSTLPAGNNTRISTPIQKQYDLLFPHPTGLPSDFATSHSRWIGFHSSVLSHVYSIHSCHLLHSGTVPHFIQNILTIPARYMASMDGVALPRTTLASSTFALWIAVSRA